MPTDSFNLITLEPARRRWRAVFAGHVIADTDDALVLREPGTPLRIYFPRRDVATEYMARSDKVVRDPVKGSATFYTVLMDGHFAENAVWAYDEPLAGLEALRDRMAFYTDKVEVYDIEDPRMKVHPKTVEGMTRADIDEAVQHTDSGSGDAQRDPWAPNEEEDDAR
jgi:uncharacterized protein (DUF427 family)